MGFQYTVLQQVGQGAYGCVWKAIDNSTNEIVAIKQLKNKSIAKSYENGAVLTEVVALEELKAHPNIIQLKEVIKQDNDLFYVFEYMPTNLLHVIRNKTSPLSEIEIKSWTYQIIQAMAYMHSKGYVHRDLKPENILVNERILKLADFGLSKKMPQCLNANITFMDYCGKEGCTCGCTTTYMCTRWYRAPEIILCSPSYSSASDMWSIGVIIAEMYKSLPIFPGTSEENQLHQISAILGAPAFQPWVEGNILANKCNFQFKNFYPLIDLAKIIPNASYEALDLIQSLVAWDPQKRLTAFQALRHPFFSIKQKIDQSNFNVVFDCMPTIIRCPPWHKKAYDDMACAIKSNEKQYIVQNTLKNHLFISSYQQACNYIQKNSATLAVQFSTIS